MTKVRGFTFNAPWRIDRDNEKGIVVVDDVGRVVHAADYGDIPTERGPSFYEQIIQIERANCYAMVEAVNTHKWRA
jgi:hypothetical protein